MKVRDNLEKTTGMQPQSMLGKTGLLPASDTTGQYREVLPHAEEYSFPVMMQSLGADLEIISVNPIWLEVLGYEESEVIGRKSSEFLTEVSRSFGVEIALPKFLETGSERDVAYQMVRKNGEVINVLLSAVGIRDAGGEFIGSHCYIWDVNGHWTSDELFRRMSLVEERNRLSRDLHDTVEHSLIGIMLLTDTVRELMGSDPLMARAELESTHALAKAGLEQVRLAVWDLQPLAITSNPLEDVISRGLSRLDDESIKTSFATDGNEPLGMDHRNKLAVIRIVQEALSNIRLHSHAGLVQVRLSYTRSHVILLITDDGVGFDLSMTHCAHSPTSRGFGLASMREAARLAGGSV